MSLKKKKKSKRKGESYTLTQVLRVHTRGYWLLFTTNTTHTLLPSSPFLLVQSRRPHLIPSFPSSNAPCFLFVDSLSVVVTGPINTVPPLPSQLSPTSQPQQQGGQPKGPYIQQPPQPQPTLGPCLNPSSMEAVLSMWMRCTMLGSRTPPLSTSLGMPSSVILRLASLLAVLTCLLPPLVALLLPLLPLLPLLLLLLWYIFC